MSIAICRGVRRRRRRTTFLLALALLIASFVIAHSGFSAGHMPMESHDGMSGAVAVCLFIAQAGALGAGVALLARVTGGLWPLRRTMRLALIAPAAAPLAARSAGSARDGPSLLQVFRL